VSVVHEDAAIAHRRYRRRWERPWRA
jgi:hypothetical protein